MKIAFLTSGHLPDDDRIYWHMAQTLSESGHKILIISSKNEKNEERGNIAINSFYGESLSGKAKINAFSARMESFSPDRVICSEPLSVMAATIYRCKKAHNLKILYDITEWYPSPRFLQNYHLLIKWFGFLKLLCANIYASFASDAFIFGEWYKSRPYRFLFPLKPYRYITYYPDLKYISCVQPSFPDKKLRLSYMGEISHEKGFVSFINVVNALADSHKNLLIEVKLIAWYETESEREKCEFLIASARKNVIISRLEKQELPDFTAAITDTDIFLELRQRNFENNFSLPIKLFYYAALGRPVIISDLRAVKRGVEIDDFGCLVNPADTSQILKIIDGYLTDKDLYRAHCNNARKLAEQKYNWGTIAPGLVAFIESL